MSGDIRAQRGERTLLTALCLSAPGPLITGLAAITSGSATQLADFLRRTAELIATLVSWWVYRRVHRLGAMDPARLSRRAERVVALAMALSGVALLWVGMARLLGEGEGGGASVLGLAIAALGLLANTILYFRYRQLAREEKDPVLAAQQRLYRAKAMVDLCVTIALGAGVFWPQSPAARYIDAVGTMVVGLYLVAASRPSKILRDFRRRSGGGDQA